MSWAPPRVWNQRLHAEDIPRGAVYIGRPSMWGNPIPLPSEAERANVLRLYEGWLNTRPDLIRRAQRLLRGRDLVCFCSPKACHGDVLLKVANAPLPVIGFTGTRRDMTMAQEEAMGRVVNRIRTRIGLFEFTHGDCVGADATADGIVAGFRIPRRILPSNVEGTRAHSEERGAYLGAEPAPPWMRDQWIVQESRFMVAAPKGFGPEKGSGTWLTIGMATKMGKKVFILWPDGRIGSI
jgi:hypothetical protein